jgi:hypothetical protein
VFYIILYVYVCNSYASTVLPFQAYGAIGMARSEFEADSASSQVIHSTYNTIHSINIHVHDVDCSILFT